MLSISSNLIASKKLKASILDFSKYLKKIFVNTILIHFISLGISFALTILRDNYIKQICWSEKIECTCEWQIAIYYIFSGVFFEIICPVCLLNSVMFFLQKSLLKQLKTKIILCLQLMLSVFPPYFYAFYYTISLPRFYTYIIISISATLYSLFYVRKLLKYDLKTYFAKTKYVYYLTYSALLYFVVMVYCMPKFYVFLGDLAKEKTKNCFQIIILVFITFYELFFNYILEKIAETMEGNNYLLIMMAKYYYIIFYSLRVGNMLYLKFTDWGFYLQFFSFLLFIYNHTTGISLISYFFVCPLAAKFLKTKSSFMEYLNENNLLINKWRRWIHATQQVFAFRRKKNLKKLKLKLSNSQTISNISIDNLSKRSIPNKIPMNRFWIMLIYQKIEFILIYVPTLLFLWLYKSWRNPEPFYLFTVGCSFEVTNINFQESSIITLILVDVFASGFFIAFMYHKGKINDFYEMEKINVFYRIIFYIGCQITFEQWMTHFSSFLLLLDK